MRLSELRWMGKLVLAFVGLYALATASLILGWEEKGDRTPIVLGALLGSAAAGLHLIAWSRRWYGGYRAQSQGESRMGRVYLPAGSLVVMGLVYLALRVGGGVSAFMWGFSGGSLGVFAIWFTLYVPRNWSAVRTRLRRVHGEQPE